MNIIEQLEQEQIDKLTAERPVPEFGAGDTLRVHVKVVEGRVLLLPVHGHGQVSCRWSCTANSPAIIFEVRSFGSWF